MRRRLSHSERRIILVVGSLASVLGFAMLLAAVLHSDNRGPKSIEADGVNYIACSVLSWFADGTFKDPDNTSYDVFFKDTEGRTRELKRVRVLRITDLPNDKSFCTASRK